MGIDILIAFILLTIVIIAAVCAFLSGAKYVETDETEEMIRDYKEWLKKH